MITTHHNLPIAPGTALDSEEATLLTLLDILLTAPVNLSTDFFANPFGLKCLELKFGADTFGAKLVGGFGIDGKGGTELDTFGKLGVFIFGTLGTLGIDTCGICGFGISGIFGGETELNFPATSVFAAVTNFKPLDASVGGPGKDGLISLKFDSLFIIFLQIELQLVLLFLLFL